jgi:hypothetical protein
VLFPEPVYPIIPTEVPAGILKEMFSIIVLYSSSGSLISYVKETFLNSISPAFVLSLTGFSTSNI